MEEQSSTDLGLEKRIQLKEIERAMAAEKHEQDKEQMTLKNELDEQRHRREMEKAEMEMKQIQQQQEEAMRIRECEMLKLQYEYGEEDKNRAHLERMEICKHKREKEMKVIQNDEDFESQKHEETMLKLELVAAMPVIQHEAKKAKQRERKSKEVPLPKQQISNNETSFGPVAEKAVSILGAGLGAGLRAFFK